jgi:glycosyltransferase involved in cell wall biosynthesis
MRITIILGPFLPVPAVLGGAVEKVHSLLAEAYKSAGHDVTIISRRYGNFRNDEIADGIRYIRIPSFNRKSSLLANLALDFCYALRASRSLPRSDITITNSFFLPLLLRHQTAGKIYVHVARFPKYQMLFYSRADRLQAISRAVAKEIARQAPSLSSKIVTIGYPIPDDYYSLSSVQSRQKVILFVGRVAREKGVHLLIESFASMHKDRDLIGISEWKLRIVGPHEVAQGGDGPEYMRELIGLAKPLGSSCEFVGPIFDKQALIEEYQAASVFVYPSLAESGEAFGLAPLEAMAAGCAVILSNLRCFDDFADNNLSALKFDHKNLNPVANLTVELARLVNDQKLIKEIAKQGQIAARKFQTSAIAGRMLNDFELLIANRRDPLFAMLR